MPCMQAINPLELASEALKEIQTRFYKDYPAHPEEARYGFATPSTMKPTQWTCEWISNQMQDIHAIWAPPSILWRLHLKDIWVFVTCTDMDSVSFVVGVLMVTIDCPKLLGHLSYCFCIVAKLSTKVCLIERNYIPQRSLGQPCIPQQCMSRQHCDLAKADDAPFHPMKTRKNDFLD